MEEFKKELYRLELSYCWESNERVDSFFKDYFNIIDSYVDSLDNITLNNILSIMKLYINNHNNDISDDIEELYAYIVFILHIVSN